MGGFFRSDSLLPLQLFQELFSVEIRKNWRNDNIKTPPTKTGPLLKAEYTTQTSDLEKELEELHLQQDFLQREELLSARRQLLLTEKKTLRACFQQGNLSEEGLQQLNRELDFQLDQLFDETAHENVAQES